MRLLRLATAHPYTQAYDTIYRERAHTPSVVRALVTSADVLQLHTLALPDLRPALARRVAVEMFEKSPIALYDRAVEVAFNDGVADEYVDRAQVALTLLDPQRYPPMSEKTIEPNFLRRGLSRSPFETVYSAD